jgi:hypothetical protein
MSSFTENLGNLENKILNIPGNIVDNMRRNNIANSLVILLLLYVILAAPTMSPSVVKLFNNNFFKLVYIFLIMCLVSQNPIFSVIGAVVLLIILNKLSESRPVNIIKPEDNQPNKLLVLENKKTIKPNTVENFGDNSMSSQSTNSMNNLSNATTSNNMGSQSTNSMNNLSNATTSNNMGSQSTNSMNNLSNATTSNNMGSQSTVADMAHLSMNKTVLTSVVPDKNNVEMSCKLVCNNKTIERFENNERLTQRQQMMRLWEQHNKGPAMSPNNDNKDQHNVVCASAAVNSQCDVLGTNKYHFTSHARVSIDNNPCPEDNKNGEVEGVFENIHEEYDWIN